MSENDWSVVVNEIDWSVFDTHPEMTCDCRCGAVFRSHAKVVTIPAVRLVTRRPCPNCRKHGDVRRASSDPEKFTIGGGGQS